MKRILFVCTGNTCRSPMAEGLFRDMAAKAGIDAEIHSAGVAAADGQPMSQHAANVLRNRGIEAQISATQVTKDDAAWADLILTMTTSHKRHLMQQFPQMADKTFTLKEYAEMDNHDIVDPFGGTRDDYEQVAKEIEEALHIVIEKLDH